MHAVVITLHQMQRTSGCIRVLSSLNVSAFLQMSYPRTPDINTSAVCCQISFIYPFVCLFIFARPAEVNKVYSESHWNVNVKVSEGNRIANMVISSCYYSISIVSI